MAGAESCGDEHSGGGAVDVSRVPDALRVDP